MNDKLHQLIEDFKKLNYKPSDIKPTYLEIINKQSHENTSSDILKFFLDTREKHCLKDIGLKALLGLYNEQYLNTKFKVVNIEREYSTSNKNRIDLWIETNNELIIIENKLYHSAINPFDDYENFARSYAEENELDLVLILLNLDGYKAENSPEFKTIKHIDFIKSFKRLVLEKWHSADQYYLNFLFSYAESIERQYSKNKEDEMEEVLSFFRKNAKEIEELKSLEKKILDYYLVEMKSVISGLNIDGCEIEWNKVDRMKDEVIYTGACVHTKNIPTKKGGEYLFWVSLLLSGLYIGFEYYEEDVDTNWYKNTFKKFNWSDKEYDDEFEELYIYKNTNIDSMTTDAIRNTISNSISTFIKEHSDLLK